MPAPRFRLVALKPDGSDGEVIPLSPGRTVWGRGTFPAFAANDLLLSPEHAALTVERGGVRIEDLGSVNGVFVRIDVETPLVPGDVFRLGQQVLRFEAIGTSEIVLRGRPADPAPVFGSPTRGAWGRIVQLTGGARGTAAAYLLSAPECTIGRDRGSITFPHDGFVSGAHAVIANRGGHVTLSDRGSSNGTFVRIREPRVLAPGAMLLLGQRLLRLTAT